MRKQLDTLASGFDKLAGADLLPLPSMAVDPVHREIDNLLGKVLGLPDVTVLRELLSREPVVCLERLH
jgi:hypothetical protein